jgi:hypothetical protein
LALIGVFPKQIAGSSFQVSVAFSGQAMLDCNGLERSGLDVTWPPRSCPGYLLVNGTFEKLEITNQPDDRYRPRPSSRLKLACLVLLRQPTRRQMLNALIETVQCEAIYCISPEPFVPLAELRCEIVTSAIDPETSLQKQLLLRCRAEVLRVVADRHLPGWGIASRVLDCNTTLHRGTNAVAASIREA